MKQVRKLVSGLFTALFVFSSAILAQGESMDVNGSANATQPTQPQDTSLYLPMISRPVLLLNDAVQSVDVAAAGSVSTFHTPTDAAPDPDGNQIYFTAQAATGAGLFRVPAGGGNVMTLTVGSPISEAFGVAVSMDGQSIFVADPSVVVSNTATNTLASGIDTPHLAITGEIFRVPAGGGTPVPVAGTGCTAPRGMTIVQENDVEMIYFTGVDPSDNLPAVMKVPAAGGTLIIVDKGENFVKPVGISVDKTGRLYVTDQAAGPNGSGVVFRIKPHTHGTRLSHREIIGSGYRLGNPAGLTLTQDESLLLVSSHNSTDGSSEVVVFNTATLSQGIVNKVIGTNHASGGLHRAAKNNTMAWSDLGLGFGGTVYRVNLH